jgi:hypothetical protein
MSRDITWRPRPPRMRTLLPWWKARPSAWPPVMPRCVERDTPNKHPCSAAVALRLQSARVAKTVMPRVHLAWGTVSVGTGPTRGPHDPRLDANFASSARCFWGRYRMARSISGTPSLAPFSPTPLSVRRRHSTIRYRVLFRPSSPVATDMPPIAGSVPTPGDRGPWCPQLPGATSSRLSTRRP